MRMVLKFFFLYIQEIQHNFFFGKLTVKKIYFLYQDFFKLQKSKLERHAKDAVI